MKDRYVPINKGNYSMDTSEREALFESYRGEGWAAEYAEYRLNWSEYPRKQYVSHYPLLVDIELSSICNLQCPMCYTITDAFRSCVNATLMEMELFTKIIDEIAGKVPAIRLSLRGEATLHPQFIECVRYAKKKGIPEVSTLTNGSTLTEHYFSDMLDAGIDWITISVDGQGSVYEGIRKPLRFDDTFDKIRQIAKIKAVKKKHKPVIKIQSIWPAIKDDPEQFYNLFLPYVDLIAFNPLIDYLHNDTEIIYDDNFRCPQLYQRLVVGADGQAMACSNDEEGLNIVGDANQQMISAIWHGNHMRRLRDIHATPCGFKQFPACRKCYLPRQTDDSEHTLICGRVVTVRKYLNRHEVIGH